MKTINKHTVLKKVRENGKWFGFIAPNKVNAGNIRHGWSIGMPIFIRYEESNKAYVVENEDSEEVSLEEILSHYAHYNCNSELGNRIRFWEDN